MIYLNLFLGFLKVGCFAFGGAYGAIPLIRDVVFYYGWLSDEMLTYMIAVSESTPGPIMVNLATYVGSSQAGLLGAAIATFAVVLPSFVIILLTMVLLNSALKNKYVQVILRGLKPCIIGIILATGCFMLTNNCFFSWPRRFTECPRAYHNSGSGYCVFWLKKGFKKWDAANYAHNYFGLSWYCCIRNLTVLNSFLSGRL